MEKLGEYINGNYNVTIYSDGTKVRENDLDNLSPAFPENIDIKITDYCDLGCPYCHEGSTKNGKHGDLMSAKFIDTLRPWTELAIGGGNPLTHPQLIPFLKKLKEKNIIANLTVNWSHAVYQGIFLRYLIQEKLIYGLGISINNTFDVTEFHAMNLGDNVVLHTIAGVTSLEDYQKLYDSNLKVLILGYKMLRRGVSYFNDYESESITKNKKDLLENIIKMVKHFRVVSFDNLALEQLDMKNQLPESIWNTFYMGDDGGYTMYIDMVKGEYAKSSTSLVRHHIADTIDEMFNTVKGT